MIPRNSVDVEEAERARERFESKYEERGGASCWPWTAGTFGDNYGRFTLQGDYYQAHRIAWALAHGEDPLFRLVLHECDNPCCVRPEHLYLGDQHDNMADAKVRSGPDVFGGTDHPNAKLSEAKVREIRSRYEDEDVTQADLADEYGVSDTTICDVLNGVLWSYA